MSGGQPKTSPVAVVKPAAMLIVNPDAAVQHLVEKAIPEYRLSSISFAFSDDFALLAEQYPPDVVLFNIKTDAQSCFSRLAKVRGQWPSTQVIFLSPVDDIHLWAEAIRLGAYDFLPKPIDPDQLKWILQGALTKKLAVQDPSPEKGDAKPSHGGGDHSQVEFSRGKGVVFPCASG
jgi:DNA-binding NtrC family response regulator